MAATESETRARQIDIQLARAGWTGGNRAFIEEFLIDDARLFQASVAPYRAPNEFADYALPGRRHRPMALVEAKRSSRSPLDGERQAADYADRIRAAHGVVPFIFLANGAEVWFRHRGRYPVRKVSGFFTLEDLERLDFLDHNTFRLFECEDGLPTFHYGYEEAVRDG